MNNENKKYPYKSGISGAMNTHLDYDCGIVTLPHGSTKALKTLGRF